ncbi:hypothetical protein G6027_00760 [Dietzia sp. SLG310A2-38A2]|uniref:hypothetical protein n=1 Tax=Dietzia sp. SLG310A2-38A2 TaxID=1630643 RepID=UPI0015F8BAC6|nr:hypothetical protein [Dietzia sp. SLG310A2-38A2]MBB1029443.1 hypothetical protein [Dietzia sp. SLG310A2-38A2]
MSADTLSGARSDGRIHGLERWSDPAENTVVFWVAPAGSTSVLEVDGDGTDAVEVQWSTLSAEVPSIRAVVLLDGPGVGVPGEDFTFTHRVAEDVARFVSTRSGAEAGPIEVLVFRPETDQAPWPEPSRTADGVEFRFRHRGGADIRLTLTVPDQPGEA